MKLESLGWGTQVGGEPRGVTGWELGTLGGSKGGIWRYSGVTQGSMENINLGTRGDVQSREPVETTKSGAQRKFGKGPPGPASPAPSLTSAYSALLLLSTSANKCAPGHVTARSSPPITEAVLPRPPLRPRPHAASSVRAARAARARARRGGGSAMFYNRPMSCELSPVSAGGAPPCLCGVAGLRHGWLADMLMRGRIPRPPSAPSASLQRGGPGRNLL